MIDSRFGASMNMLFIILIVSGILLLLLLLFYYISLAIDSWDVNSNGNQESKTDFLNEIKDENTIKEIEKSENTIKDNDKE